MAENKSNIKIFKPRLSNDLLPFELSKESLEDYNSVSTALVRESFLEDYEAEKVSFKEVLFKNVMFTKVSLQNCELDGFAARVEDVRGAVVSTAQAISLTSLLGLVIKE